MTEISPDDQAARDVAAARLGAAADALARHGGALSALLRLWAEEVATNPWPGPCARLSSGTNTTAG